MKRILIPVLLLFALASCDGRREREAEPVSGEVEFLIMSGQWTYISLGEGKVLGNAPVGDEDADALWAARDDWDIAVCDSLIRTNGGTSGYGGWTVTDPTTGTSLPDCYQDIW